MQCESTLAKNRPIEGSDKPCAIVNIDPSINKALLSFAYESSLHKGDFSSYCSRLISF